jgi:DNA invertase Pin-like site-specific DNA recombinase
MIIGYARTSTIEQKAGFEAQERDLKEIGAEKVFSEQVSSVAERAELERAIEFAREGDVLVVTKLDRLARSVANLTDIVQRLQAKGVALRILNLGLDTATPTGKLMLNLLGSIAQFEREIMLERQREGIAKAKAAGKYVGGRPATIDQAEIVKLHREGKRVCDIVAALGVSRSSVERALRT